ncbi:MAG: transglycosylase domain-containing protein, partial [Burkholderiales bacterium]
MFVATFAGVAALSLALATHAAVPAFDSVRAAHVPSERLIHDRYGAVIHHIRSDDKVRRTRWVTLDEASPALIEAVLASEDKRFFEHGGVDLRAAAAAAITNLRQGGVVRGASSISMQVAA